VVRVLPPLIIDDADIRAFVDGLSAASAEYDLPAEAA
jgi:acetylornithine/N-succinyldiaminopimelate aminotransferase